MASRKWQCSTHMARNVRGSSIMKDTRFIRPFGEFMLALVLVAVLAACGVPEDPVVGPIPTSEDQLHSFEFTEPYGAAVASLEERAFLSDVIVRASLVSTGDGTLTFNAIEYMMGTGDQQFTVGISTDDRNTQWDAREAVLFLSNAKTQGAPGATFSFADTTSWQYTLAGGSPKQGSYTGDRRAGHSIDSNNPVWMPSTQAPGASAQSGRSSPSDPSFITESKSPSGETNPEINLSEIKMAIAWVDGGRGITGYDACIQDSLQHQRIFRDSRAYFGDDYVGIDPKAELIASGSSTGTAVYTTVWQGSGNQYPRFRLSGHDAELFTMGPNDPDGNPEPDYPLETAITRPLPTGVYTFKSHYQSSDWFPCKYDSPDSVTEWTVTVTAPTGTVHEAFFDPQTIGSGDGYVSSGNLSTGDLSPAAFTTGDTTTTITSFYGTGDAVTMILSPYVDLTTHIFDFITGDGTTMLSLTGATGDSAAGALTWGVSKQPWSSGDQLMLRISEPLITLSDNLAQKESSDTTLNLGTGYNTGPVLYQKLGPKVKLDNSTWAYGSEHDKFAVHRITLASDPGVRLTARFCRYDDDLHTIYHGTDSTFDYNPATYEDCLAGDFVSSSDTAEGRRVLVHSTGGSVEIPGNGQKESQKWYLRIAPSDVSASSFKVRFTNSNEETGWAIANKVLWTEVNTGGSGSNDKANRLGKSVALQIDGRRLGCPSGMDLVDGRCTTP